MPSQSRPIGKDTIVFQDAVVRDVHPDHEIISRADACRHVLTRGAMNGHIFANQIVIADQETARFATEFQILRFASEGGMFEHAVPFAQARVALYDRMRSDLAASADEHALFDDRVRPDRHVGRNLRPRTDDGTRVNCHAPHDREFGAGGK